MTFTFRHAAILAAGVSFALALVWLCAPQLLLSLWAVDYSYSVGLVGRRGAALFAGIGVMFVSARNAGPSPSRIALARGFSVACLSLATLGVVELSTRHAGPGIVSAVAVEVALALTLFAVTHGDGASSRSKSARSDT